MKENKITVPVYRQLKCDKSVTPKIYGLPKLHKSGIPLRPIVSFIGAPTYQLSKFLVNVLSPLLTYDFSINNSKHFVQRINEIQCDDNNFLVSFDVKSLFTCIPVPDVLKIIENLLLNDAVLAERTKLSVADIMSALKLCLHSTIFTFKNVLYRQICWAPMGSCISPVVANIFMEYIERQALASFRKPPKIWIRYVDDIFCIINYSIIDEFLQHINSISLNIQFTVEIEKDRSLPFLDVQITRNANNTLRTTIYQKPTHTNRYLQFDSHHPRHHKIAVAKSLFNRVDTHISNVTDKHIQRGEIKEVLTLNGFPTKFSRYKKACKHTSPDSQHSFSAFTTLPYIQGVSDKIQRVLNSVGVKVALKPLLTIGRYLPSLKDPILTSEKSCLIYKIPCNDCEFSYIGQTKRDLKTRILEHQRAIRNQQPEKSALCEHSMIHDHRIAWQEAQILKTESDYSKRLFAESWFINKESNILNRNDGVAFPSTYTKLLNY